MRRHPCTRWSCEDLGSLLVSSSEKARVVLGAEENESSSTSSQLLLLLCFFFPLTPLSSFHLHPPPKKKKSIAPTAEEEEELDACDAWVAALVDAEIADEQQEAFHLESERELSLAEAFSASASVVSVR